jgi:hypothetical protein
LRVSALSGQAAGAIALVPGAIQFSAAAFYVSEGVTMARITVTRTGNSTGAVGVSYATGNGTAKAGSDYTAKTGTLGWAAGDTADKTFRVSITDDAVKDPNETFTAYLSAPTGGAVLGTPESATVVIPDND